MKLFQLFKNGYFIDSIKFDSYNQWINYCEKFLKIRIFSNFWSMAPCTDDKIMLLSTSKTENNQDYHVSRPSLLDWHYDGIGIVNREDLICLYCKIPNSVTSIVNLSLMYHEAPDDIKSIIDKSVIELNFNEQIYQSTLREKVLVKKVNEMFEKELFKPAVINHPITNKKSILYHPNFVTKLHGITDKESRLFITFYNDKFNDYKYSHFWNQHDILIIDQNMSIHSRNEFTGERELWRISGWFK